RRHFLLWSAVGAVLWASGITVLGYFLGGVAVIRDNLEVAALLIVAVSVLPVVWELARRRSVARTVVTEVEEVVDDARGGVI
ncbi:MAG: DedA family protein, partial [Phycicoccus sp.]